VPAAVLTRALAGLRRGNGAPAEAGEPSAPEAVVPGARAGERQPTLERASLGQLAAAVPGLREELVDRARSAGVLVGIVAALVLPAWTVVDRVAAPGHVSDFLLIRLLLDLPILAGVAALWRLPVGRRRPERLTFLILAVVQLEVAWMIPRVDDAQYYLLGYTVAIYVSGGVLVMRPRWTGRLVALSWAALGLSALTAPAGMAAADLLSIAIYLGTASTVAILAHVRRYALNNRELATRVRLEHEQERTRVLLARLERLSQEDPLTGLANRRRWDLEVGAVCREVREHGGLVSLVLLDIDHFKDVNDRHGHLVGDVVLREVASVLSGSVRAKDRVARWGGEEFLIALPGGSAVLGAEAATRLRRRVEEHAWSLHAPGLRLTVSAGVSAGPAGEFATVLARADAAVYAAKRAGRNQVMTS
jgi:diguanylate cyclase (GGDEF)-like protein